MTQGRKSQRYLSGRSKIIGFSGLSTDRHLYVEPGQVEPNLGFPGEKSLPVSSTYYKLITVDNGSTFDRYWQEDTPATLVNGITIFDEGTLVGTANTVSKLNFVGAAVTATASGTISTITVTPVSISTLAPPSARHGDLWWDSDEGELNVYYQDINSAQWVLANSGIGTTTGGGGGGGGSGGANVTVSSNPPTSPTPSNGDLWWDSDIGELYIYYTDGDSNQWVETSGGSETVTISDNPPSSPNDGDLWWESDTGSLKIYYNDGDSQQWVDSNAGVLSSLSAFNYWQQNSAGINTTSNVGIGTTNVSAVDANNTAVLAVGIVTAHKYFGDGSNLTGISGSGGAQGAVGATGAQGATGSTGSQGATGSTGAQGANGSSGSAGAQGAQGVAGSAASQGAQGAQGATGGAGSTGAQGAQGVAGTAASQGAQGATGATGAQGATGSTGSQGAAGSATISNNASTRLITGGSGTNLNAEANLTFSSQRLNIDGGVTINDNGVSDEIFKLRSDDQSPWLFNLGNDTYNANGGLWGYQADNGDFYLRYRGNGEYKNFYIQRWDGTTSNLVAHFDYYGRFGGYYQNTLALHTAVDGIDVYAAQANQNGNIRIRPRGTAVYSTLSFMSSAGSTVGSVGTHSGASTIYYVASNSGSHLFHFGGAYKLHMTGSTVKPQTGVTLDLGTSTDRFDNLYINDLQLSNKSKKDTGGNDVDGTWGDYTIQEGESDLFLINNRNGKKYKFNLTEVS